ncbi:ankyrin repeat-containing domain, PGG domain protein, partial [Tanacetum coccineum]
MTNAASTSDPNCIVEVLEEYPHPSHVIAPNFVTMKLGGKDTYNEWETQIVSLLKSHQMFGFINGEFPSPAGNGKGKDEDIDAWTRSDSLVKSWILGSLSEEASRKVVNHLTDKQKKTYFTAKDLWDELRRSYGPSALTWNPSIIVEVGKAYPYASHVNVPSFVTVKLSGKNKYNLWETQMLCLLKSHQMYGFINGQFPRPAGNGEG